VTERVCRACEVAWKSADGCCWCCGEPGELALTASLMRPTWPHRNWIGWTPTVFASTAPDDVADYLGLIGG
jgi:predicted amidophosphoribosyltransferase